MPSECRREKDSNNGNLNKGWATLVAHPFFFIQKGGTLPVIKALTDALPENTKDLIIWLDQSYPTLTPRPGLSMDEIMYNSGQRSVVVFLKQKLEDAERSQFERED